MQLSQKIVNNGLMKKKSSFFLYPAALNFNTIFV